MSEDAKKTKKTKTKNRVILKKKYLVHDNN